MLYAKNKNNPKNKPKQIITSKNTAGTANK